MSIPATLDTVVAEGGRGGPIQGRTQWQQIGRAFRADRPAVAALIVVVVLAAVAVCAPVISAAVGHGPNQLFPNQLNAVLGLPTGPSSHFLFGVDQVGRDVFVRCVYGLRTSLIVSLLSAAIATAFGVTVGMAAGYFGGWMDTADLARRGRLPGAAGHPVRDQHLLGLLDHRPRVPGRHRAAGHRPGGR